MHVFDFDHCAKQKMQLILIYPSNWKIATEELAEGVFKPTQWVYTAISYAALAYKGVGSATDPTNVSVIVLGFTLVGCVFSVYSSITKPSATIVTLRDKISFYRTLRAIDIVTPTYWRLRSSGYFKITSLLIEFKMPRNPDITVLERRYSQLEERVARLEIADKRSEFRPSLVSIQKKS